MDMHISACLGLDLSPQMADQLTASLPAHLVLRSHAVHSFMAEAETRSPHASKELLFIPVSVWDKQEPAIQERIISFQNWQRVLVVDTESPRTLEYLASGQFLTILTCPVNTEKIAQVLRQAEEVAALYNDIFLMAQEISLERELLTRKNEQLSFLNQILTSASKSLDPAEILSTSVQNLNLLLNVQTVLGIFWEQEEDQFNAELFLPANITKDQQEPWVSHLLGVARRFNGGKNIQGYQVSFLPGTEQSDLCVPERSQLVTEPLMLGDEPFGALIICSEEASTLGQDRAKILHSATTHLALAMRNGLAYRKLKERADHDGLTRISNRQNFDQRLREEMKRHQRHSQDLSIMMLDLDFFKSVNDTYGHLAGDMVLREVGRILQHTVRECDFPARYGGEEFVIILPQTGEDQAWLLAERIRNIIEHTRFQFQHTYFRVTASIGIAHLRPSALTPAESLVHLADQALYRAKTSGRNMVCSSSLQEDSLVIES